MLNHKQIQCFNFFYYTALVSVKACVNSVSITYKSLQVTADSKVLIELALRHASEKNIGRRTWNLLQNSLHNTVYMSNSDFHF